jgi:hypothetical protein
LTTSSLKPDVQTIVDQSNDKVKVFRADYADKATIDRALHSVDVLISAMTFNGGSHLDSQQLLIESGP